LGFYDFLEEDLLRVIEESRMLGKVTDTLNTTFIALIPNEIVHESFDDYRLVSPCNSIYKIITKILANMLKEILLEFISEDRFGFLHNTQIRDVVGTTQTSLYTIKVKRLPAIVMKLDLARAYDKVN
jgi:hypothetical protein